MRRLCEDRFTEDALRILRAVRFAAQLDFVIEDETYRAIAEIAPNLVHVSKERIQVELTKLLLSIILRRSGWWRRPGSHRMWPRISGGL